jgi:hypothetical protein
LRSYDCGLSEWPKLLLVFASKVILGYEFHGPSDLTAPWGWLNPYYHSPYVTSSLTRLWMFLMNRNLLCQVYVSLSLSHTHIYMACYWNFFRATETTSAHRSPHQI